MMPERILYLDLNDPLATEIKQSCLDYLSLAIYIQRENFSLSVYLKAFSHTLHTYLGILT